MLLVAASLVFIVAMAALAIDLGTLYVVRSDMQRTADAAALAGARAFVDSSITSGVGVMSDAQDLASQYVQLVIANSPIAGRTLNGTTEISITFPGTGISQTNPEIQVTLTRSDLPTFFAKIWGTRFQTVSAKATAEAYNPSGNSLPVASSIKPWALPNCDPNHASPGTTICQGSAQFVDPTSGTVLNPDIIGQTINLQERLVGDVEGPGVYFNIVPNFDPDVSICPALGNAPACIPSLDHANYYDAIQCSTNQTVRCGQALYAAPEHRIADMQAATSCMIHANGLGLNQGQDIFASASVSGTIPPVTITAGTNNPSLAVRSSRVTNSDSVVTVPLFEPGINRVVTGFLQLGVTEVCNSNTPECGGLPLSGPQVVVLNVAGCGGTTGGYPVTGSGTTPVTVRLIANGSAPPLGR